MHNSYWISLVFFGFLPGIRDLHLLSRTVEQVKLVLAEEGHPVPLPLLQVFLSPEVLLPVVVCPGCEVHTQQIMSPLFQGIIFLEFISTQER